MKTKLVYVLTCEPVRNYIEQALISIYTARFHNPNAHIVLVVDDVTDKLFTGKRAEILDYISEKIVVELSDTMSMMRRSRYIKTNIRNLLTGDILFIDCDTIITGSLQEIDTFNFELGAVLESHLPVNKFHKELFSKIENHSFILNWDLNNENHYYSSGVIYAKDTEKNALFFKLWNKYWDVGTTKGVNIDQPSFAKVNIEMNYPIQKIEDTWNCVMYTHPTFVKDAKILHFCSFRNMSYVYNNCFLRKVLEFGIRNNQFIKSSILNPHKTYIPFDNEIFRYKFVDYFNMFKNIRSTGKLLKKNNNSNYENFFSNKRIDKFVIKLFNYNLFNIGSGIYVLSKYYKVKLNLNYKYIENNCSV